MPDPLSADSDVSDTTSQQISSTEQEVINVGLMLAQQQVLTNSGRLELHATQSEGLAIVS